jgi:hypothetical protein
LAAMSLGRRGGIDGTCGLIARMNELAAMTGSFPRLLIPLDRTSELHNLLFVLQQFSILLFAQIHAASQLDSEIPDLQLQSRNSLVFGGDGSLLVADGVVRFPLLSREVVPEEIATFARFAKIFAREKVKWHFAIQQLSSTNPRQQPRGELLEDVADGVWRAKGEERGQREKSQRDIQNTGSLALVQ